MWTTKDPPLVFYIESPTYKTTEGSNLTVREHLDFKNPFSVKPTKMILDLQMQNNRLLVSFVIFELFPSYPAKDCIKFVKTVLFNSGSYLLLYLKYYQLHLTLVTHKFL